MRNIFKATLLPLLLICALRMNAQDVHLQNYQYIWGLYDAQGNKLTNDELQELSVYGFDYERYKTVNKQYITSFICLNAGALVMSAGCYIDRKGDHPITFGIMMASGFAVALSSHIINIKAGKELSRMIDNLNSNSVNVGFTPSGFGLSYSF